MMKIICRCEDITEGEIIQKIKEGYQTMDELKRILRVTMGLCQGKGCRKLIAKILSRELGIPIEKIKQPTYRPPTKPVPIRATMDKSQTPKNKSQTNSKFSNRQNITKL